MATKTPRGSRVTVRFGTRIDSDEPKSIRVLVIIATRNLKLRLGTSKVSAKSLFRANVGICHFITGMKSVP